MADKRILLSGGSKTIPTREDLENNFWSFFKTNRAFSGANEPKGGVKKVKAQRPTPENPPSAGAGVGGAGEVPYVPALRSAVWCTEADGYAASGVIGQPHLYSSWTTEAYLMVSFWAMCYNHTESSYVHPWVSLNNVTYASSGFNHGPRYNGTLLECLMWSSQRMNGYHQDYRDAAPTTVLGAAGDGNGSFKNLEWHHFCVYHSYNGILWVDGVRTWGPANDGEATWSVSPDTTNGFQNLQMVIGNRAGLLAAEAPKTNHFGVSNFIVSNPADWDVDEFNDIIAIDPADSIYDRYAAWSMRTIEDDNRNGILWHYPFQADCNDIGPYAKHLTLSTGGQIASNNGTYDGPTF